MKSRWKTQLLLREIEGKQHILTVYSPDFFTPQPRGLSWDQSPRPQFHGCSHHTFIELLLQQKGICHVYSNFLAGNAQEGQSKDSNKTSVRHSTNKISNWEKLWHDSHNAKIDTGCRQYPIAMLRRSHDKDSKTKPQDARIKPQRCQVNILPQCLLLA
jgi:hypothetical protein